MSSIVPVLLTRAEVLSALRIKKSKLHADIAEGTFPRAVKFGTRSFFVAAEIQAWLQTQIAKRDADSAHKAQKKAAELRHSEPDQN
jgi:predicted DNA-binding transcriptional regulator AlpA